MAGKNDLAPVEQIQGMILTIRGQKVILDEDLADLYGVDTRTLNQAVKRNLDRFPEDFMFQLTKEEHDSLRSQIVTSKPGRGGRRYPPYAFTEHGALMAANILNSEQAIEISVFVVRAFIKLREVLAGHKTLAWKLEELEGRLDIHDEDIQAIMAAIKSLMLPPKSSSRKNIGFKTGKTKKKK